MFDESECYPYFSMSRDIVGCFTIICTFGQPMSNRFTIGWGMVFTSTSKTKNKLISNLKQENGLKNKNYQNVVLHELQTIRLPLFSLARIIILQFGPGQNLNSG